MYPGTFNPPTIGHLAIVDAALRQHQLDQLDLVLSAVPLGKDTPAIPTLAHRAGVIEESLTTRTNVRVLVTELRLIADIATGYDVVVMGADKWAQVNDVAFYDDALARDAALARLPQLAIAGRDDFPVPADARLEVPAHIDAVSSSAARAGSTEHMTAAARRFDATTGAWTDPTRYRAWLGAQAEQGQHPPEPRR